MTQEGDLPFDLGAPMDFYAGEFPKPVLDKAAELRRKNEETNSRENTEYVLDDKDAICLAMKELLGNVAAREQQPGRIVA